MPLTRPDSSQIAHSQATEDTVASTAATKLREVKSLADFGAVGDGTTNDTLAVSAAFSAGLALECAPGAIYKIDANLTIASGTRLFTRGATFRIRNSTNSAGINVADDVVIDELNIHVPSGITSRGAYIQSRSDVEIGRLVVEADMQQGPTPSTIQALAIDNSSRVRIGYFRSLNYDRATRFDGCADVQVNGYDIEGYVRGLYVESCQNTHFGPGRIHTASASAAVSPGHNGILVQSANADCDNVTFARATVEDAGEHAIRVGGGSFQSRNLCFDRPLIKRPGSAGIKVQAVTDGASSYSYTENVQIIEPVFEDIGPADMSGITDSFDNYNAMVLKYIRGLVVTNPIVRKNAHTYSAKGGIYLMAVVEADIDLGVMSSMKYDGLKLDMDSTGNVDCQDVNIDGGQVVLCGQHGINIVYPDWTIRRLNVRNVKLSNNTGYGVNISVDGGTGTINTMHITGVVEGNTAGGVSNDNVGVVLQMAGQFNAATARDGSTWLDRTAGTFKVLKAAVWTAL